MNQGLINISNKLKTTFGKIKRRKSEKSGAGREFIAKLSRGLMLPIAILPIAGIFLGVGSAIVNNANGDAGLTLFGNFLKVPGDVIFGALPVLFAIAIAIAFTRDAGPAGLSALVGFLVFSGLQSAVISSGATFKDANGAILGYNILFYGPGSLGIKDYGLPASLFGNVLGITQLVTSVFGGFIVGFTVSFLYNKFKNIELPKVLGFFNGVRFIPIVTFVLMIPIAFLVLILWPLIGTAFNYLGQVLGGNLYGFNSFVFGYIERSLVPFGLHHAFYSPLWYTQVGGSLDLTQMAVTSGGLKLGLNSSQNTWLQIAESFGYNGDNSVTGDQNLWFFANSYLVGRTVNIVNGMSNNIMTNILGQHTITFSDLSAVSGIPGIGQASGASGVNIGQYLQGKYVFMMFGLPAAAAAMVVACPKENRKLALSIVASAGFTAFLTGITEPLEFTFLFLAPWLFWGFHAFMCALAFGLMNWIGLIFPSVAPHIGMTFSGGIIDWVIYGGIQIQYGSNAWWSLAFGVIYVPIYFFFFLWAIKKFNIATPGRGENTKLFTKADWKAKNGEGQSQVQASGNLNMTENRALAIQVVKAYGGFDNIKNVDACITKLRIQVANQDIVDGDRLTSELGASGVIKPSKQSVYAVYGAKADRIKNEINEMIYEIEQNPSLKDEFLKFGERDTSQQATAPKAQEEKSDEKIVIKSPVNGKVVPLEEVPDDTFAQQMMGTGVAIIPSGSTFVSPINGTMSLVFDTGHAYTFESKKGTQILIHIGIDSINLKDKDGKDVNPFTPKVKTGDVIKVDEAIASVKINQLKDYAKSIVTPVIVLDESLKGREVKILKKSGNVTKGEPLFEVAPVKAKSN